ncbi:MAG: heme-binding domain-containing protein, partial [Planctomycetota bacterium]|nr:heme-binding domain-containing protein [Planctomycetota bacterium]
MSPQTTSNDPTCAPPPSGPEFHPDLVARIVSEAQARGDAKRGAMIFGSAHFACISCHKVGEQGGQAGPLLSDVGRRLKPEQVVEALFWPNREVKPEYRAWIAQTVDGKNYQGYKQSESAEEVVLRDPAQGTLTRLAKADIEELRELGTLMPEGLTAAMSTTQRGDIVRFLLELGHDASLPGLVRPQSHEAAEFEYNKLPLDPARWPFVGHPINRDRLYDFYTKEARHFAAQSAMPILLPGFPGLDGGTFGHWGNQNEQTWASDRWNATDLGSMLSAIFRGPGVTVAKGVCVRLGDAGELAACFNPQTLSYDALWREGFLKFSTVRHGFMEGALQAGTPVPRPAQPGVLEPFQYHGFYRYGKRVVFAYRIGEVEYLDAPWVENGQFQRVVDRAESHPLADLTKGGPAQWPQVFDLPGQPGMGGPYVVDRIPPPFDNPWKALMFFSGHDFLPDGTAFVCTMQGDVWQVTGLDETLAKVQWRRFASGLNQPLGLQVVDGVVHVLGRDQLTRLHDLNGDGEADFYECASNAYTTSTAGHDFICGLERDAAGNFYTASGNQGLLRISADGKRVEVMATGFRNPDGLGIMADGSITIPCSEGEWTPASTLCQIRPQAGSEEFEPPHFGYPGPKNGKRPTLPLLYLPRGLDNSAGGQVAVHSDRWGPLDGLAVHLSFGTASHFLLLRDEVDGQPQGAVVPLPGEFSSGAHRGRFNPHDGQLYVTGMAGWGAYNSLEGCFERVRYTGGKVQLPRGFHAHQNGVLIEFTAAIDPKIASDVTRQFAQAWNYRYSAAYGSEEYSPSHRGAIGHDPWAITRSFVLADGKHLFLEIPDLQPVSQLQLHLRVDEGEPIDMFLTVHSLAAPFTALPGYRPVEKTIAAHPLLVDLATQTKSLPNP